MPSFDIASEVNMHEVANALDQANREVGTRYDFKGSDASCELVEGVIVLKAQSDFQLQQMADILYQRLAKRGVDVASLEAEDPQTVGQRAQQKVKIRQGIDADLGRKIVKLIKDAKLKVQASIQGDEVRVTGKKRDDLQEAIALLRGAKLELPLQYRNFRD